MKAIGHYSNELSQALRDEGEFTSPDMPPTKLSWGYALLANQRSGQPTYDWVTEATTNLCNLKKWPMAAGFIGPAPISNPNTISYLLSF